jgi:1L-myo-inositol 1-phosphate cytidylyltransferase
MKCLVLAAGFGSRLREISASKPLTPVAGVPLIEHVIARAVAAGASEFVVVTGHQADHVEGFLTGLRCRFDVNLRCVRVDDWSLPNGHSVLAGSQGIDDDYLLLMSDHLFDPSIARELLASASSEAAVTLAVDRDLAGPLLDLDDATKVATTEGRIVRIGKDLDRFDAIDTGIFLATPALADAIRANVAAGGGGSLSEGVQRLADEDRAQTMDVGSARWIDVDSPRMLALAEAMIAGQDLTGSSA